MAPGKKSRSVNKRFFSEASPEIDVGNSRKTKLKKRKKFTDKLGPQWTREELERFYAAYRKYGGDWKKVTAAMRNNRSVEMVEALFNMNRAYLSLPEGTASVAGLIAMMTDHYSVMEGSDSEREGHDASGVLRKHGKIIRARVQHSDSREEVNPPRSVAPAQGCLAFLKQTPTYGMERCATGKRTLRVPVEIISHRMDEREGSSLSKRAKKLVDANDDDAHVVAFASAGTLRRGGGSPIVSKSPYRRTEPNYSTPIRNWEKMPQAMEAQAKDLDRFMPEEWVEISRDRKYKKGASDRDGAALMGNREACSDIEGHKTKSRKAVVDIESSRDESDAVQALIDLSGPMPLASVMESESSPQFKEKKIAHDMDEKYSTRENPSTSYHGEKGKQVEREDSHLHAVSAADNRKPKSAQKSVDGNSVSIGKLRTSIRKHNPKVLGAAAPTDCTGNKSIYNKELAHEENMNSMFKTKRAGQGPVKQLKTVEESSSTSNKKIIGPGLVSTTQVSGLGPANLLQKPPNRRKMSLKRNLQERAKSSGTTPDTPHSYESVSEHELLKQKLSTCLSNPLVRRRCIFEWFYSAIDYPWFANSPLNEYLNHAGLDHVQRLNRPEWSIIKRSFGGPRRFSERFLQEEREKLNLYRDYARKHYTELRDGAREGIPTHLARPLSVGNKVIAIHPKTREIRDGKILTVDHNKCNVLFEESGVDLVMDTDCMPSNPLEYLPEGLRKQNDKYMYTGKEAQHNRDPNFYVHPVLENVGFPMNPSMKKDAINGRISHCKVLATKNANPQTTHQSYITDNSKTRGAEIQRALLILQHPLDEKEMEPEMLEIAKDSKSIAQAMVDAAMKAVSLVTEGEDAGNVVRRALDSIGEQQILRHSMVPSIKHQERTNGSLDHHHSRSPSHAAELMTNGFISQDGSGKNEKEMISELITSCVSTCLRIKMCTERQYAPANVAQLMDTAASSLQPRCPQNMQIYREIQTCMGMIKTQIMALVRT